MVEKVSTDKRTARPYAIATQLTGLIFIMEV